MFIEQYRLEANPFAPDGVRPVFSSHSMRYSSLKLDQLFERRFLCLFLSGPAGVGKSTLVRQKLRAMKQVAASWVTPETETVEDLFRLLLHDLGPGTIEGRPAELRNILEVYLRHEAGKGRPSFIVADGLQRFSEPVLREFEALARLRVRNQPAVYFVMPNRNEDLVTNLIPQYDGGPLARAIHQRLTGLTLEETRAYVYTCLQGAGCDWSDELMPEDVIPDIQAFTQGVIGDINALCKAGLDTVAARTAGGTRQPSLTHAIVKEAATELHLRYNAATLDRLPERTLSVESVHITDPNELRVEAARLLVSSGRQLIAEVTLNRPRMVLGRDTSCDISLDSMYVSRYQNLFMETDQGWLLIDLSSTNGCFVNGRKVREHRLRDGDLIAVGHHELRFAASTPRAEFRERSGADGTSAADTLIGPGALDDPAA